MKPTTSLLTLLAAVLLTSTAASAQIAPPTPASVAGWDNTGSFMTPKARANFYLEGGPTYMHAASGSTGSYEFFGGYIGFGWRLDQHQKVQIDLGSLAASNRKSFTTNPSFTNPETTYLAIPVLASYSYCIPLGNNGQWEIRLAPTIGTTTFGVDSRNDTPIGRISASDSSTAFAYGAGLGVTWHLSRQFYIDAGYRYLRTGSTGYTLFNEHTRINAMNTSTFNATFGWKF